MGYLATTMFRHNLTWDGHDHIFVCLQYVSMLDTQCVIACLNSASYGA